ncbi:MAG: hypothetical protein BGN92_02030 [Sphingobacteriales bacterium 41-5]|nr:MAG: hypothetical protein BGN92_02030 [Sphingobacteriales bacterium 41-5]
MKQLKSITNRIALVIASFYLTLVAFAQDDTKKIDVDINANPGGNSGNFFMQPWVWVVGGLVFILLLVALMRGSGSKSE